MTINNTVDSVVAFVSGDLVATILIYFIGIDVLDVIHPILKLIMALLIGMFGGLGGLLIKDFYPKIKKKIAKWVG